MRVHELAKELGVTSKELISTLEEMGVSGRSASSSVPDELVPRLLARTTLETRQDLVAGARQMMGRMSVQGIVANQQGMMLRPDSIPTLKTINVPALIVSGEEDTATPLAEAELMKQHLPNARLEVVPKAGHYAAFEQPEYVGRLLRSFVDGLSL